MTWRTDDEPSALGRSRAIWRKHRIGQLSAEEAGLLTQAFEADWHDAAGPFVAVALGSPLLAAAAGLVVTRPAGVRPRRRCRALA